MLSKISYYSAVPMNDLDHAIHQMSTFRPLTPLDIHLTDGVKCRAPSPRQTEDAIHDLEMAFVKALAANSVTEQHLAIIVQILSSVLMDIRLDLRHCTKALILMTNAIYDLIQTEYNVESCAFADEAFELKLLLNVRADTARALNLERQYGFN